MVLTDLIKAVKEVEASSTRTSFCRPGWIRHREHGTQSAQRKCTFERHGEHVSLVDRSATVSLGELIAGPQLAAASTQVTPRRSNVAYGIRNSPLPPQLRLPLDAEVGNKSLLDRIDWRSIVAYETGNRAPPPQRKSPFACQVDHKSLPERSTPVLLSVLIRGAHRPPPCQRKSPFDDLAEHKSPVAPTDSTAVALSIATASTSHFAKDRLLSF